MADDAVPSLSSNPGSVGSRFVSQNDIDTANSRRDEQWRAAYARLGQEPPPRPQQDVYDGRSLAEKLAANKIAKQEEWEEKTKLANQFRALEEDEVQFLDTIKSEQERKELKRKLEDAEEVKGFMQAIASRNKLADKPDTGSGTSATNVAANTSTPAKDKPKPTPAKKIGGVKGGLKGVVLKKKTSGAGPSKLSNIEKSKELQPGKSAGAKQERVGESAKKQKTS